MIRSDHVRKRTRVQKNSERSDSRVSPLLSLILGTLIAILISLSAVMSMALLITRGLIDESTIAPLSIVFKLISVAGGVFLTAKGIARKGWLHGGELGLLYIALCILAPMAVYGQTVLNAALAGDVMMCWLCGTTCGIVRANFSK